MTHDPHPGTADPVRRLLSDCATIAFCDPTGSSAPLRDLLADHYRIVDVGSPADPRVSATDLLVVASPPSVPVPAPEAWPPAVWLQPGVALEGIPGHVPVHRGEDLRTAFTGRFLSSCSG